jgi:chemotaxis protein CheC
MKFELSALENDALTEVFNLGVGRAAAAMSQIVGEAITMSFPRIVFQSRNEAARALGSEQQRKVCAVTQHYRGAIDTEAILMFPEERSLDIVRLMLSHELVGDGLSELEQEAISEIGNIVLNNCMSALATLTGHSLEGSLPAYRLGTGDDILRGSEEQWDGLVLTLEIAFNVEAHDIEGYLAVLLDVANLAGLKAHLGHHLAELTQ